MKRREFLHKGLSLGAAAGLLPSIEIANAGIGNTPPLTTESALLTTSKMPEAVNPSRGIRYFFTAKRTIKENGQRISYKCQHDPPEGTLPIWVAAVREDWDTFKQCLDDEPSLINVTGSVRLPGGFYYKDVPLIHVIATWSDDGRALRHLIHLGADVDTPYRHSTPLHFAVRWTANTESVKYLISEGADVNAKDIHGRTPLYYAAGFNPNVEVAKCLVENGADVRIKDKKGITPFDVSFNFAKSEEVGLYFLELMMGRKGVQVTDPVRLAEIKQRFAKM